MTEDLTSSDVEQITDFLSLEAEPEGSDLAVLFGGRFTTPAHLGVSLFNCGKVNTIAATGGVNPHTGVNEAQSHASIMVSQGVPSDRIIIEDESKNTLENVLFLLPKVTPIVELSEIKSLIVVTKWYHCRRAMMTLRAHLPASIRYFAYTFEPPGAARLDWHLSPEGRRRVLKEWNRIPTYLEKGDLVDINMVDGAYV